MLPFTSTIHEPGKTGNEQIYEPHRSLEDIVDEHIGGNRCWSTMCEHAPRMWTLITSHVTRATFADTLSLYAGSSRGPRL